MENSDLKDKIIRFMDYDGRLSFAKYIAGERIRIDLVAVDTPSNQAADIIPGESLTTVTVNLPEEPLEPGHVFLKTWAENEGLAEVLEAAGLVERTGRNVRTGHVLAPEVKLLFKI